MQRFRLNLVISERSDPTLHKALTEMPADVRAARLKEMALAGLLGIASSPRPAQLAHATPAPVAQAPAAVTSTSAQTLPLPQPALDIEGQLNGLDDLGLSL